MDNEKKPLRRPFSLQVNEDALDFSTLSDADFAPATKEEQEGATPDRASVSYWADAWRRMKRNTVAMVALVVVAIIALFAFLGPVIVPYSYEQFNKGAENIHPWHYTLEDQARLAEAQEAQAAAQLPPDEAVAQAEAEAAKEGKTLTPIEISMIRAKAKAGATGEGLKSDDELRAELGIKAKPFGYSNIELERKAAGESVFPHVFGADGFGRDIMVRTMMGARVSLLVGLSAALLVLVIGALYGSISGYCGGKVDTVMQRIVEVIYSLPEVLVILLISTVLRSSLSEYVNTHSGPFADFLSLMGPNLIALFIAFGLLYWVTMSRIIRGQILQLKGQEYVTAARALGAKGGHIIRRHLLPNCIGQIVVTTCLQIPSAIFLESFLSFLGVGVDVPMTSLGSMCSDALGGMQTYAYRLLIPALILSVMILSLNLVGDGLRDALDPKLKK